MELLKKQFSQDVQHKSDQLLWQWNICVKKSWKEKGRDIWNEIFENDFRGSSDTQKEKER